MLEYENLKTLAKSYDSEQRAKIAKERTEINKQKAILSANTGEKLAKVQYDGARQTGFSSVTFPDDYSRKR